MPQMAQYVFDFYQTKLNTFNQLKKVTKKTEETTKSQDKAQSNKDRIEKLDEEEKVLREKLGIILKLWVLYSWRTLKFPFNF